MPLVSLSLGFIDLQVEMLRLGGALGPLPQPPAPPRLEPQLLAGQCQGMRVGGLESPGGSWGVGWGVSGDGALGAQIKHSSPDTEEDRAGEGTEGSVGRDGMGKGLLYRAILWEEAP